MASNTSRSGTKETAYFQFGVPKPGLNDESASASESDECGEAIVETHPFSEPWEDSDLVLVVKDEKFHVHRQILSIHSPVFKAMLNTQFKEATATEIPLPGKKPHEILDFLKQLYLKERDGITLNKMEHVLKLADEYQATSVVNLCVKCLKDVPKSKVNVVKILFLANNTVIAREDDRLDSVRRECHALIQNMELADILKGDDFENLDRDSLENVFVHRTKRLETFLKGVYPQFIGLVEFCITLCMESSTNLLTTITRCPEHFPGHGSKANEDLYKRIKSCSVCRKMIVQLVSLSKISHKKENRYGGICHFDQELITIIQDFENIFKPYCDLIGAATPGLLSPCSFTVSPSTLATSGLQFRPASGFNFN